MDGYACNILYTKMEPSPDVAFFEGVEFGFFVCYDYKNGNTGFV